MIKPYPTSVNSEDKILIAGVVVIVLVIAGGYSMLLSYTEMSTPFSVVMSESMQHDTEQSKLGYIDTGDVVVVKKATEEDVQSYVKGTTTGYQSFGDYGSVIIYERGNGQNPVIHRAIIWLNWDGEKWSSPELAQYEGEWYCESHNPSYKHKNAYNLSGTLHFEDLTASGKNVSLNLNSLKKNSGFLTMGDNPIGNTTFDQSSGIAYGPISIDLIKSVPIAEIPWIGSFKVMMKGGSLEHAPNNIPSLLMSIITFISLAILIDIVHYKKTKNDEVRKRYR